MTWVAWQYLLSGRYVQKYEITLEREDPHGPWRILVYSDVTMETTRVQWRRVQWRRQFWVTLDCFVDILQRCSIFILYYICIKSTIWGLLKRHFKFQNELPGITITMVFQQALVSPLTIIFPFSFDYLVCVMSGMALKQRL